MFCRIAPASKTRQADARRAAGGGVSRIEEAAEGEGLETDRAAQLEFGVELRRGDADPRRLCRELALGPTHVGPLAQEVRRHPDCDLRGQARDGFGLLQLRVHRARRFAQEDRQAVLGRGDRGAEGRDLTPGALQVVAGLLDGELVAEARLGAPFSQAVASPPGSSGWSRSRRDAPGRCADRRN